VGVAQAATIVESTGGTVGLFSSVFLGQGFTTPGGGPWDNITSNFFLDGEATAFGTAYLFTSVYGGTPLGLSSSAFLAASTGISAGAYVFNPVLTLQPNTTFYLYVDTPVPASGVDGQAISGTYYVAPGPGSPFTSLTGTVSFRVSGEVSSAPIPEPSVGLLSALGLVAMGIRARSRVCARPRIRQK
jgi:hypothetical protein